MQGFVLEGYPKTQEQYENMKNMQNLKSTLTIVIDLDSQESMRRGV
jgi:adenylate kinase family enzyme